MAYQKTTATRKLQKLTKRIRGIAGGTSASKTVSILLILINYAQTHKHEVISVVSESMPHLRKGAMRDFLNIMQEHNYFRDERWEKTNSVYTFETGSILEFFGAESWEKVKGARRDVLFINEANHISFNTFNQLEVRTKKIIWLDWNPESDFWWYTEVGNGDVDFITLTYLDNEALDKSIVASIEGRRGNIGWFKVYGLGELGTLEGKIFNSWQVIDEVPAEARLERYGLDFGYSNDPTASDAIYRWNGGFVIDEVLHQKGLSNKQIADVFISRPRALVIADSAEPKSIDEIILYGINVQPTTKGPGSVNQRIQFVQEQKIWITKRSINTLKEYRSYLWLVDKDGKSINEPSPVWNHHMDDIGYAISSLRTYEELADFDLPDDTKQLFKEGFY